MEILNFSGWAQQIFFMKYISDKTAEAYPNEGQLCSADAEAVGVQKVQTGNNYCTFNIERLGTLDFCTQGFL